MTVTDGKSAVQIPRPHRVVGDGTRTEATGYVWAAARLALGWVFVWAFVDKLFGLGHETTTKQAWIHGASPTKGFLAHSASGPFQGLYHDIAGAAWADWLFMLGLAGIGGALILGIGMRLAAAAGVLLLMMMWSVVLPPENNLFMDEHLIYALLIVGLAMVGAGNTAGLGRRWAKTTLVRRFPILK